MKFISENKKSYILLLIIIFTITIIYGFRIYSNYCIERYIKSQGLEDEEILEDTGLKHHNTWAEFKREIVYKNDPTTKYIYSRGDATSNLYVLCRLGAYDNRYFGVMYSMEKSENIICDRASIPIEGELDKDGKLLKNYNWK